MKKRVLVGIVLLILVLIILFSQFKLTGNVISDVLISDGFGITGKAISQEPTSTSPSIKDMECMEDCVSIGCESGDRECMTLNNEKCSQKCGVDISGPPKPSDEGEECMQKCTQKGCSEYDYKCTEQNKGKCEEECNMKGDAPDESEMDEEQKCISECVAKIDSSIICSSGSSYGAGEQGNQVCQKCATECVHLYAGPCLDDEQITEKEKVCGTCEHCYGSPVMGDSGEGYECIVDIECADASSEFGDEPGSGEDSFEKGHEEPGIIGKIAGFFKGLFGGE